MCILRYLAFSAPRRHSRSTILLRRCFSAAGIRKNGSDKANIVTGPYTQQMATPRETLFAHVFGRQNFDTNRTAVIDAASNKKVSYDELLELITKAGSALVKSGVETGDVIVIVSPNSTEFAVQFFASSAIGGVVSTVNPSFTAGEMAYQFKDCGAKYIATASSALPQVKEAASQVGIPNDRIIVLDADGHGEHISFQSLLQDSGSCFPTGGAKVDPDSVAVLPYSSGTTGLPKGVMLSHHNMVSNLCRIQYPEGLLFGINSKILSLMPMFHIYGMVVILSGGLSTGATLVSLPKFEPELFLRSLTEHKITDAMLVTPLILFLANHPLVDQYNLSSLVEIFSGGAPLSEELASAAKDRLGNNLVVRQGYGLTETSSLTHICPSSVHKPSCVGVPIPNTEVVVVEEETGAGLPADAVGEIWVRGPHVMKGYLNRPKETAASINQDGWFKTGDIGYYDQDGHFHIVDRLKELIKVKGFQVAPAELEGLLLTHPQIADCAVVGVADERAGEFPRAFVVAKSKDLSERDVESFVASKLSKHKHLKGGVVFVESVPKSPSGKILRRLLRE